MEHTQRSKLCSLNANGPVKKKRGPGPPALEPPGPPRYYDVLAPDHIARNAQLQPQRDEKLDGVRKSQRMWGIAIEKVDVILKIKIEKIKYGKKRFVVRCLTLPSFTSCKEDSVVARLVGVFPTGPNSVGCEARWRK
jgi:hypothetical protein